MLSRFRYQLAIFCSIALLGTLLWGGAASAQEGSPGKAEFGVTPFDVEGSYFSLEMQPGESRSLSIEFKNSGAVAGDALTYTADTYTLINGGMGVRTVGEAPTGPALWTAYERESLTLAPDQAVVRTFNVAVPEDVAPGEYLSAVVIQEAAPSEALGAGKEGVSFNTLTRQAIAVAITVPGEMAPALELGGVAHATAGGNSVVSFELTNSGNERTSPSGTFTLKDANGAVLTTYDVNLGAIYAGDSTLVEVPFGTLLNPGEYSASLTLADEARGVSVEALDVLLMVEPPAQPQPSTAGAGSSVAVVEQQPETAGQSAPEEGSPIADASGGGMPLWALGAALALALAAAGVILTMLRRRGGTSGVSAKPLDESVVEPAPAPSPAVARPEAGSSVEPVRARTPVQPRRLPVMRKLPTPGESGAGALDHQTEPSGDR